MLNAMKRMGLGTSLMLTFSLIAAPAHAANTATGKITAASVGSLSLDTAAKSFTIIANQTKIYDGKKLVASAIVGRKATVTYAISGAFGGFWTALEVRMAPNIAPVETKTPASTK